MNLDAPFGRVGEGASAVFMRGGPYLRLLQSYVMDKISAEDLQAAYRETFFRTSEADRPDKSDELGRIIAGMMEVLDRFTKDRNVIAADPEFFVSEKTVREQAVLTLQKLRILNRSHS